MNNNEFFEWSEVFQWSEKRYEKLGKKKQIKRSEKLQTIEQLKHSVYAVVSRTDRYEDFFDIVEVTTLQDRCRKFIKTKLTKNRR